MASMTSSTAQTRYSLLGDLSKKNGGISNRTSIESLEDARQSFNDSVSTEVRDDRKVSRAWLYLNIFLFCSSSILFIVAIIALSSGNLGSNGQNSLLKQTSYYSPMFNILDIPVTTKKMNATLLDVPPSIFRGEPSPEVDAAWIKVSNTGAIPISKEDVIALGKSPGVAAKWPESFGFGSDAYIGRLDVFHQVHCLDAVRREAYFEHYYGSKYPGGYNTTSEMHKLHLSHCIYLLLQNIMCSANVDVYTHFWIDTTLNMFPDFNINHKCRSFDAILDWQEKNAVDAGTLAAIRKPDDYGPAHVMSSDFKKVHHWYDTHVDDGSGDDGETA